MDDDGMNGWAEWTGPASDAREPIPFLFWEDVQASLDAADFVEGLLLDCAMSVVYGQSNSGKTFWVSDMAMHVAAGRTWNGREVEQGGVIWLAMEGAFGISNRITAWKLEHGLEDSVIPFAVVPVALNLLHPDGDTRPLIAAIRQAAERLGVPVRLIVVDTLSRAIAGGNENAPDDMGALVTNGTLLQQSVKAHVLWIHHSGKDEARGARGHSLLRAATDTEIEITASGPQRMARVTKQRELDGDGEFPFQLRVVELGMNKRGKPVTSCVVEPGGEPIMAKADSLTGHNQIAMRTLHDTMAATGRRNVRGVPDGCPAVHSDDWRREFYLRCGSETTTDAKSKAFRRAQIALQNRNLIAFHEQFVWLTRGVA